MTIALIAANEHLRDVDFEAESCVRMKPNEERLTSSNVKYTVHCKVQIGRGEVEVVMVSEETPLTFPPGLLGEVLPIVLQKITVHAAQLMNETMKGAFDGDE